jgi:hypothetical protein
MGILSTKRCRRTNVPPLCEGSSGNSGEPALSSNEGPGVVLRSPLCEGGTEGICI